MADRLDRLDAARESLAFRDAEKARQGCARTRRNQTGPQAVDNKGNGETADFAPSIISEA